MALTANTVPYWYQGLPVRQAHCTSLNTATQLFKTAVAMQVNGVATNVVTGTAMQAFCLANAGGDANSGFFFSARSSGIRVALISGAAESINIVFGASTIDINVTYNNGVSTPLTVCNLIRSNGQANQYLRCRHSGTGAGTAIIALAATAVPFISLLGCTVANYDNSAGVAPLTFTAPDMVFDLGTLAMAASGTPPPAPGDPLVFFNDNNSVKAARDPLDIAAPLRGIENGKCYVDLAAAF